jgi:hypothetical protein
MMQAENASMEQPIDILLFTWMKINRHLWLIVSADIDAQAVNKNICKP